MVDLVIINGKLVRHDGIINTGIAVSKGQIVAIGDASVLPSADRTLDMAGKYILPGLVDGHVHLGSFYPFEETCLSETSACAAGGVTTIGIHVQDPKREPGTIKYAKQCRKWLEEESVVDALFHARIWDEQSVKEIPKLPDMGIISCMLAGGEVPKAGDIVSRRARGEAQVFAAMEEWSKLGPRARAFIHPENMEIAVLLRERLTKQGRKDFPAWNESRPWFCEVEDLMRKVFWSKVLNCPLYFEHLSAGEGVEVAIKAKEEGVNVIFETCPQYLTHTSDDVADIFKERPALGHVNPPLRLRSRRDNERLWQGIRNGWIDTIGSDHASYTVADKGDDIMTAPPGLGGLSEMILPVMFSEGVNKGRISLEKLVEVCCFNPAKVWGVYPQKGTINVGSDADIVVVDPDKKVKVSWKSLHSLCDWSIYEGWEFQGWPVLTLLRGEIIVQDGKVVAKPGTGKYLFRRL